MTNFNDPSGPAIPAAQSPSGDAGGPPPDFYGAPGGSASRRNWLIIAIAVLVAAALVLIAVVVTHSRSDATGAASPDGAALDLLGATSRRDPMAVTALLAPAESAGFAETLQNLQQRAKGSGLQRGGGMAGLSDGMTVTTKNVTTTVGVIRDDLAKVTFTGGTITTDFDPAKANAGLREAAGKSLKAEHQTVDIRRELAADGPNGETILPFVMAVKQGGQWYVSPSYTIAEYAAAADGSGGAAAGNGAIDTTHFATPEAAVDGFLAAVSDSVKAASVIPLAKALPSYYGQLVATYPALFQAGSSDGSRISFAKGSYRTHKVDGVTLVDVKSLNFAAPDGTSGEHMSGTLAGNCVTLSGQGKHCSTDAGSMAGMGPLGDLSDPSGVVTTKDGAGWHVDPEQTILQSLRLSTRKITDQQFNRFLGIYLHIPQPALNIKPDATLTGNTVTVTLRGDTTSDATSNGATGADSFSPEAMGTAVVGLQVTAGQKVTLDAQASGGEDFVSMMVATPDGWANGGIFGDSSGDEAYGTFSYDGPAPAADANPTDGDSYSTDYLPPTDSSTDGDYSTMSGPDMGPVTFTPKKSGKANIIVMGSKGASITVTRTAD